MTEPSTDKSPQEIKGEKIVDEIQKVTGISFTGDLGEMMARRVHDAIHTGERTVDPDKEDSPIHCCAEWHFARFSGPGATLVPLLYQISFHLAHESGNFFLSGQKVARYLGAKPANIYAAAHLLVASGFWKKIEAELGKVVKYSPVGHQAWAEMHPGRCTQKLEMNFTQDDEELAALGRNLYAIMGGEQFFPHVLLGIRKAADGYSDQQICELAKQFMDSDNGKGDGKARRKRFVAFLRTLDGPESSNGVCPEGE